MSGTLVAVLIVVTALHGTHLTGPTIRRNASIARQLRWLHLAIEDLSIDTSFIMSTSHQLQIRPCRLFTVKDGAHAL